MNLQDWLNQLMGPTDDQTRMEAARHLESWSDDSQVMDVLCAAAVNTIHHGLREVLLTVLKSNAAGAYTRFSDVALWSKDPVARKHALMNLCLMGCREAKNAVISGLFDPDASVRKAAAMCAGLYEDNSVHLALEQYFETHCFDRSPSFIGDGLTMVRRRLQHTDDDGSVKMPIYTG